MKIMSGGLEPKAKGPADGGKKTAENGKQLSNASATAGTPFGCRATIPQPGGGGAQLGRWVRNVKNGIAFAAAISGHADPATPDRPHTSAAEVMVGGRRAYTSTPLPPSTSLDNYFHSISYAGKLWFWQHYSALSTVGDTKASIFIFDKKSDVRVSARLTRFNKLALIDLLRYDVGQLASLAHPRILRMLHTAVEDSETLSFACEPIQMTMEQLFKEQTLHLIEMKICVIQLSDGLSYLHNSAKILHGNLAPDSIYTTTNQHWKIANFSFSVNAKNKQSNVFPLYPWTKKLPACLQPDLDFVAPEYLLSNAVTTITAAADVFSLGVLICWIFCGGKRLIDTKGNVESYKIVVDQLNFALDIIEKQLGDGLKQILTKALSKDPADRPTPRQLTMNKMFDEPTLNALRSLDDLGQEFDPANKAVFLSHSLLTALPDIPEPLWFSRVLMRFNELLIDAVELYPVIVRPLVYMLNHCESHNIHRLASWFRLILDNAQEKALSQVVVDNMPVIFRRLNDEQVDDRCFDLLMFILSGSDPHLKQTVLRAIPKMADYLPLTFVGQRLVPMLAGMAAYFEQHVARQIDLLVSIVHLSDRCDANLLRSLLSLASHCNAVNPAVIHLKSRLVQRIITCDVSRLNDPQIVAHHLLNPLVLGLALPEMSASHFEEVMSSSRVLLEIIEQLRYQSGNFLSSESGRRLCNRRVSMSSNHLPRLLVTAARPSFGDGRKMSFLSAYGRLEDRSRRESKDSRCSFESDVSLRIGNGSDLSDDSATQTGRSGSGQRVRRKSWLEGYMHSMSLEQSSPQIHSFTNKRRGSAVERNFRNRVAQNNRLIRFRGSVMSDHFWPALGGAGGPLPPPLSRSACGYVAEPSSSLGDVHSAAGQPPKAAAKPTTLTNLSHNLACTLWKTFY